MTQQQNLQSTRSFKPAESDDVSPVSQPLTVHLKSVGLEKFLIAVCVTGVVAHVGRCHLGDVQRAVISKVLPDRVRNKRGGQLLLTQKTHWRFSAAVTAEEV